MFDAIEATKKIAGAGADLRRAQNARSSPTSKQKIKAAERRLATLLTLFIGFKGDPDFDTAYQGAMSVLDELQEERKT
jgi:hypothetical protein